MKISIIGAGTFGVSLAKHLSKRFNDVFVYTHSAEKYNKLISDRKIQTLPNIILPSTVKIYNNLDYIVDSDVLIIAVASLYFRDTIKKIKNKIHKKTILVTVTKGIEKESLLTMSQVIESELGESFKGNIVALSGPSHAEELAMEMPTTIVSASKNNDLAKLIQDVFMNEYLRVYTNDDILGVEICGAVKNILALACGISTGLGYGDNLKAAIMTRGMAEMVRLGERLNCKRDTFYGLAGMGDLIVTAISRHSRNNRCGEYIGSGLNPIDAINKVGMVVEGINAIPACIELSKRLGIDMPITYAMDEVINMGLNPRDVLNKLMLREKKSE